MSVKTAVFYWTMTGNTEMMAEAIAEGAGADLIKVADYSGNIEEYVRIAVGCPAMDEESLEATEFEPFFSSVENKLNGKTIALFGSYDWGDGQWMRDGTARARADGAVIIGGEGLIANNTPDDDDLAACRELGKKLSEENA